MNKVIVAFMLIIGLSSIVFADYNKDIAYVDGGHQGNFISNMAGNMSLDQNTKYEFCETRWNKVSTGRAKYGKVNYYGNQLKEIWIKSCVNHIKKSRF